ncbi:MAG: CPBP family glutamic-type intramembrane protease [Woeseiaceae bacterium]
MPQFSIVGKSADRSDTKVLIGSTVAFTAWHVSAISLDSGDEFSADEVPIFLIDATLIGAIPCAFRVISGSAVLGALCHAVWNGSNYPLVGFGEKPGAPGIQETHFYGPEVGLPGIGQNLAFRA